MCHLAQIRPADLHIPILGQLAPGAASARRWSQTWSARGAVRFDAPLGGGQLGEQASKTRRGTLTTPWYSPISTPKLHRLPLGILAGVRGERRLGGGTT
jgi:hypothetical protein